MLKSIPVILVGLIGAVAPAAQAQGSAPPTVLFKSDTLSMGFPALSPDGRWVAFVQFISNQETRLMIRAVAGGEPRVLFAATGTHNALSFSPRGDRVVFVSTMPRRGPADDRSYLVMAPFDTRTGTLSGDPRQISLDGVRSNFRLRHVISPDGQWVAYLSCCTEAALKVVPITGGNPRTIATTPTTQLNQVPGWFSWSADSRFVGYHLREEGESVLRRVSREGGPATVATRFQGPMGTPTPDGRHFVAIEGQVKATLRVFNADGKEVASMPVPRLVGISFSADGRSLVGIGDNSVATIKVVPVDGGPSRTIGRGDTYEWAEGWSADGRLVHISTADSGGRLLRLTDLTGKVARTIRLPVEDNIIGIQAGHLVYRQPQPGGRATIMAMNLDDGSKRELVRDVINRLCCESLGPGGMYYGIIGNEFYYRQVVGNRMQFRAMSVGGPSRLLLELPRASLGQSGVAVAGDRLAWYEPAGDSARVRVRTGAGRATRTLASFHKSQRLGEFAWSHDGQQLAVYVNETPQRFFIYRFDANGDVKGQPQSFTVPFEYFYETFWLRDGSGVTMIAQPRGAAVTEVAIVKFDDPSRPILLTRDDPVSKWGHALSPDGKYVAYPSERLQGSSIYSVDLTSLLKPGRSASR